MVPSPGGPVPTPTPMPFSGDLSGDLSADVLVEGKPAAIQGSIRAIWESKDRTRSHALATGMMYTDLGNPIGLAQVDRSQVPTRDYEVR